MKILLVEDDVLSSEWLSVFLQGNGLEVATAFSVPEALNQISSSIPDIVVTDIGMRGQDGFDLLEQLRSDHKTAKIPVVAVTGYDMEEEKKGRFFAYLSKPLDANRLLSLIERIKQQEN